MDNVSASEGLCVKVSVGFADGDIKILGIIDGTSESNVKSECNGIVLGLRDGDSEVIVEVECVSSVGNKLIVFVGCVDFCNEGANDVDIDIDGMVVRDTDGFIAGSADRLVEIGDCRREEISVDISDD